MTDIETKLDRLLLLVEAKSSRLSALEARLTCPDRHLTAREAAAYLGVSYGTFRNWATQIKRNRTGRYRRADLDKFAATRRK